MYALEKKSMVRYININYQALSFFKVITHVFWIIVYIFFNIQKTYYETP